MKKLLFCLTILISYFAQGQGIPVRPLGHKGYDVPIECDTCRITNLKLVTPTTSNIKYVIVEDSATGLMAKVLLSSLPGSGSGAVKQFQFYAVATGDSTLKHDSLINKTPDIDVSGLHKILGRDYVFNSTTGTITFRPALWAGEPVIIRYSNAYTNTVVTNKANRTSYDVLFPTVSSGSGLAETSPGNHTWQGSDFSTSFANYGLSNQFIPAGTDTAYYEYRMVGGTPDGGMIAFNTTNSNQRYFTAPSSYNYEAAIFVISNGLNYVDNAFTGAETNSIGYTVGANDRLRLARFGSTVYAQSSADAGVTWTTRYTFHGSYPGILYLQIDLPPFTNLYNPVVTY